ncbi:type II secretion system protein GspE [Raoultella terrigena]|uniref:type II secretion system protein GspE n=1 Tax=Raoultella terrigena TaxID=577 RepID=UPI000F4C892F|nr:type II secretion system protein GspE [Raoultella terrigena]ROR94143.1 protein transport protein HofB [Raoultella terrigena]
MKAEKLIALCQRYHALLLNSDEQTLSIAVVDSPSPELMEALRFATQKRIDIECWSQDKMNQRLQSSAQPGPSAVSGEAPTGIIDQVNQILEQALRQRASDIHVEPGENSLRIRLRVDGVLHPLAPLAAELALPITARLKVLGNLDIAEHRLPQDGQFTQTLSGQSVSFRIATLPCRYGEKIVLRLLHQVEQALDLEALGLSPEQLAAFVSALNQPQGLLLVTGPTGSGKTITLYSALQKRNRDEVNICSVEDPLEIPIAGMNQTQINPRSGLTFNSVLRALLRQDPDVVMVGEIRDAETAEIAIKAAQTGHLVLSTLHTNSTSETLIRLQQMGIACWMLSSALSLVIAQRLVRRLCPHCRREAEGGIDVPHSLWPRRLPRWQATGCRHCYHGYYGRLALFEVLPIGTALQQAISRGPSAVEIEALAREAGMTTLFESGCLAIEQGLTCFEEVVRVLGLPHGD